MSADIHPQDKLAALEAAVRALENPSDDPLQALNVSVLRAMLDDARREARA